MSPEERMQAMIAREYQAILDNYDPYALEANAHRQCNRLRCYIEAVLRGGYVDRAIEMLQQLIDMQKRSGASDFCDLAAAYWLQSRRTRTNMEQVVANLRQAFECDYGDSAKNMTPALLLYYVAVRTQDQELKREAINQIDEKLATGWSRNWPAPLGRYLIGSEGVEHVEKYLAEHPHWDSPDERCRFEFYRGVKLLESGDEPGAMKCFHAAVEIPDQKTNSTEFVLAREELGETPQPIPS